MPEPIGTCRRCKQDLFDSAITDGDEKFHDECFYCDYEEDEMKCHKELKELEFHRKDGKRFCTNCYSDHIAEVCTACRKKIVATLDAPEGTRMMKTQGDNLYYHYDCFICSRCPEENNQIGEKPFTRMSGTFVCQDCYKKDHPDKDCKICGEVINTSAVKDTQSNLYHRSCFVCCFCKEELAGKKYINRDNERYCKDCFDEHKAPICSKCDNRIKSDEQVITYNNNPFCGNCFICHKCGRTLSKKSFYDRGPDVGFECSEKDEKGNCL